MQKMTVEDLFNSNEISLEQFKAELIRRFNEQDAEIKRCHSVEFLASIARPYEKRIKELEGIVKNYQETCEKMINR